MLNVGRKPTLRAPNRRQKGPNRVRLSDVPLVQTVPDGPQKIQEHCFPQLGGSDEPPGKPISTEKEVWGESTRGGLRQTPKCRMNMWAAGRLNVGTCLMTMALRNVSTICSSFGLVLTKYREWRRERFRGEETRVETP